MALLKHAQLIMLPDITYGFYPVYCGLYEVERIAIQLDEQLQIRVDDYLRTM